jgi:hypothetical protein
LPENLASRGANPLEVLRVDTMKRTIKLRQVIASSFFVNLFTWLATIVVMQYLISSQLNEYRRYSMVIFIIGIAFGLFMNRLYKISIDDGDSEWPSSLLLLHAAPLIILILFTVYRLFDDHVKMSWGIVFVAPYVAGTGLVKYFIVYRQK